MYLVTAQILVHWVWDPKTDKSDKFPGDADAAGLGAHFVPDTGLGSEKRCWKSGKSASLGGRGPGLRSQLCCGSCMCCVHWVSQATSLSPVSSSKIWDKMSCYDYLQKLRGIISHLLLGTYQVPSTFQALFHLISIVTL